MSTTTSPGSALALSQQGTSLSLRVQSPDDLQRLARLFAASGLFGRGANPDALMAECAIKILAGMEAGFGPFASAAGVSVINGKPGFGANLLAQAIKRHPIYDYRVLEKTDAICRIKFLAGKEELGVETFTMDMAKRAGLVKSSGPWAAYPEAMLFARCLTAGMRTHCPDALGGVAAYTPEELGATGAIDENGAVTVTEVTEQPTIPSTDELVADAQRACTNAGLTAEGLSAFLDEVSNGQFSVLPELPISWLTKLAKSGVSPETVARCNAAAEALVSPADDADDLPATWAEPATAAAA